MKSIPTSTKTVALDTLYRLKATEYGKFQLPEQINPVALAFSCIQIVFVVFGSCELFKESVQRQKVWQCIALALSGLFMLYAAVIKFLYAMSTYQMTQQIRRPKGKHSFYDVFISKMMSVTYSVECISYSLMFIALNKGIPVLLITVLGPSVVVLTLVIICISIVRNVSYFDTSLTQMFNLIFNMIVLLGLPKFEGKQWTIVFFALEIFSSILDAVNSSLIVHRRKTLNGGYGCAIILGLISTITRTTAIGTYFLSGYMIANHYAD